jgi:hypothetical protein
MLLRTKLTNSSDFLHQMSDEKFKVLILEFRGLYTNFNLPPSSNSVFKEFGAVVETESGLFANLDAISDLIMDECIIRITTK